MSMATDVLSALEGRLRAGQRVQWCTPPTAPPHVGTVYAVDDADDELPYHVVWDNGRHGWCAVSDLVPVEGVG